jgi:Zn-finger nucleic acid-binding protein
MNADAATLHCPNCGAAADPEAGRCKYCQARLATVACPACFALMFEGSAYCPKCGAARALVQSEDTAARCPSCRGELHRIDVGATPLLECAACDGIWVDADVFERLCVDRESQAAILPRLAARTDAQRAGPVKYRPCVRCGKMMNRINFGSISGAVVDVCKGHGTFLDAGELHQIVTFIRSGGLDRARARKLEEIKEEQRRLTEMQHRAIRDAAHHPAVAHGSGVDPGSLMELIDLITGRGS